MYSFTVCAKLKAWEEQQADWESQKIELEQRAEDGEEKADKLEKYDAIERISLEVCFAIHDNLKTGWEPKACKRLIILRNIMKMIMMGKKAPSLLSIRYWQEAQTLCRVVSQRLADAQSQSESLEIKYSKAKRLVREYQSRYLSNPSHQFL